MAACVIGASAGSIRMTERAQGSISWRMRHRVFVHLTWTTRDRAPLIDRARAAFLMHFLPAVARQESARVLATGLVTTHAHLLLQISPATDISLLVQRLKGGSAMLAGREGHGPRESPLRWARGYNMESVSPRALPEVVRYIERQSERHPREAIVGWNGIDVASATAAEPRL
jgi:REP element-mobilizing transposase RayT